MILCACQVRGQFDKARITWESKERELEALCSTLSQRRLQNSLVLGFSALCEVLVRTRDRLVTSLKNEIELVAESWEVKHLCGTKLMIQMATRKSC